MASGRLRLEPGVDVEQTIGQLLELPGIGDWTAQYVAMRALGWPDAFPENDLGIKRGLNETSSARIRTAAEAWRPWRSYAVMHIWNQLSARSKS
jgi:AraC family transcriptional regulator of adaptative response / DNA-3-methyladenine glycosylase II